MSVVIVSRLLIERQPVVNLTAADALPGAESELLFQ
jgi:hypothetical protein